MRTSAIGLFRSVIDRSRSAPSGSSAAAVRSPLPWGAIRCRGVRRPTGELVRGRSVVERLAYDVGRRAGAKDAPLAMHEEGATRREMRGENSESTNRRNGRERRTSSESCCSVGSIWSSCTDDSALLLRSRLAAPRRCTRCDLLNLPRPRPAHCCTARRARAPPQRTPEPCQCQRARREGEPTGRRGGYSKPPQLQAAQVDARRAVGLRRPRADRGRELEVYEHVAARRRPAGSTLPSFFLPEHERCRWCRFRRGTRSVCPDRSQQQSGGSAHSRAPPQPEHREYGE